MKKIVLNSSNADVINDFSGFLEDSSFTLVVANVEKLLFDNIQEDVYAFVLDNSLNYVRKASEFIKRKHPYIPIVVIERGVTNINNADVYVPEIEDTEKLFDIIVKNVLVYHRNYGILQKLTIRVEDNIEFEGCTYDPTKRILYREGQEVSKFSVKGGGVLEILASNFGKVVKKGVILEKVWRKDDYFTSRSMDVYVTMIRKVFRENGIDLRIKNISGVGLVLE